MRDRGPGLTPDQAALVFERFYRIDPSRSRALGGSGIGLAIARALAEAMDGRVWVESAGPGTGSTFGVAFPAQSGKMGDTHRGHRPDAGDRHRPRGRWRRRQMMGYGWAPGLGAGLWMIGGLLLVVGVVFVVVWAVEALWHGGRGGSGGGRSAFDGSGQFGPGHGAPGYGTPGLGEPPSESAASVSGRQTPDEILRERFARGEITEAEYEGARRVLGLDR